jgi:hypothetical protein
MWQRLQMSRKASIQIMSLAGLAIAAGLALLGFSGVHRVAIAQISVDTPQTDDRPWERLPDGRVVIEIKGVRVAMPIAGPDLQDIRFPRADGTGGVTLREVIDAPGEARAFFNKEKRVFLSIPADIPGRQGLLLRRFDREAFKSFRFSFAFGERSQANCQAWAEIFGKYRTKLATENPVADPHGWVEFVQPRSPRNWIYMRPQDEPSLPKHFSSINCGDLGSCSVSSCIGNNSAFSFQFNRGIHKREVWGEVVRKAAEIMRFVRPQELAEIQ